MASGTEAFKDDDNGQMITEINVTPLVDITLVLLIIFMVTTSYIVNPSIKVDLPRAASGTEQMQTRLALTVDEHGNLFLNGDPSNEQNVQKFIAAELPGTPDLQAIIAADKNIPHGRVVGLIDLVKKAGVRRFAINVEGSPVDGDAPASLEDPVGATPSP